MQSPGTHFVNISFRIDRRLGNIITDITEFNANEK